MKKVSIIIPCYNAEKYIERCINSLINQTIGIQNLELIFVNDASVDHTYEILCKWEQKYPDSICVVNCEENGKQGKARNIGLSYATAKYIGFADNDDILEESMLEKLFNKAEQYQCDLIICRSKKHRIEQLSDTLMGKAKENDSFFIIKDDADRETFLKTDVNTAIWNKLYKKSVIEDNFITFPEGYIYDDICFSELIKHYVSSIYIVEEYLYHHILRSEAASYSAAEWKNKLGYFDVQKIKIQELRNRGIYNKFSGYYENEFFIDYITLIKNFFKTYGDMPASLLNEMKNQTIELFPDYKNSAIIQMMQRGEGGKFLQLVSKGLNQNINDEYVHKIKMELNTSLK